MTSVTLKTSDCRGYQQIASLSGVVSLAVPSGSLCAVIHAEGQPVRWRDDGTAPTATVGMLIPVNGELRYDGNLLTIRFIETAASAKLNVSYYA